MLLPEVKTIETQDGFFPSSIYTIPNSSGIAYWLSNEDPGNDIYFIIDFGRRIIQ